MDFHEKVEPMFRQKHLLQQQNECLAKTRDQLLPRLISGKLAVEHLAIQFPPGMAEDVNGMNTATTPAQRQSNTTKTTAK